jgi:hypothetical protein
MIDKIPQKEAREFVENFENRQKFPKIYAMVFHYLDLYDNGKSQYVIKGRKALK